ncbi:MAG TPA: hypothetical protein VHV27_05705 [Phenylobacterium sp.]|jgi:hypothetical protein|nr:hypothetical protein [Phenylobacterium sp.]
MKLVLTVVGILAILMGIVWFLQGIGVLPGSFMSGQVRWAVYGGVMVVFGLAVLFWARRRPSV